MSTNSKIEWTDATWNVVTGCEKVSPGCDNPRGSAGPRVPQGGDGPVTAQQLQFPEPVHGVVNLAAGEHAKWAGMAAAEAATDISWADACDRAIQVMARRGTPFQAADLIAEGLVDEPAHPNQWGARFGKAARDGVIRAAGAVPSKRATVHRSLCRQWVGTGTGEVAA